MQPLEFAKQMAVRAGEFLKRNQAGTRSIRYKDRIGSNLVTDMDHASEAMIVKALRREFPDHAIVAEESGLSGDSPYKWYIDPVDGTKSFIHGVPLFGTLIGLEFQELTQGSRTSPAYHGQATLSRWRLANPRIIRFRCQSEFWRPRWFLPRMEPFQERLGGRIALITEINTLAMTLMVYNLHLESRGSDSIRLFQLTEVLQNCRRCVPPRLPTLIAGDLNSDASRAVPGSVIRDAGFRNALGLTAPHTTPARGILQAGRSID